MVAKFFDQSSPVSSYPESDDETLHSGQVTPKTEDGDDSSLVGASVVPVEYPSGIEAENPDALGVSLHSLADRSGLLVSVVPPKVPESVRDRVPCDIVIVIDKSGSMQERVNVPGGTKDTGLDLLGLAKHCAKAVLHSLDSRDRFGIVSFSNTAKVVLPLMYVTRNNQQRALEALKAVRPHQATNLWAGIETGVSLWDDLEVRNSENVKALYVLTDGISNANNPDNWEEKLRQLLDQRANTRKPTPTIHTFGVGTKIQSALLQLVAQVGYGNYAYVSDAGMFATVFVNAVANLLATFATDVTIVVGTLGHPVLKLSATDIRHDQYHDDIAGAEELRISLGNVQYGQSRDYIIPFLPGSLLSPTAIEVSCHYTRHDRALKSTYKLTSRLQTSALQSICKPEEDYHLFRAKICDFIGKLCSATEDYDFITSEVERLEQAKHEKMALAKELSLEGHDDLDNASLLSDLIGNGLGSDNTEGQISLALENNFARDYYRTWGAHYLRSLLFAHSTQSCNTFKDAGPLRYGSSSPLLIACRSRLDSLFNELGPPTGTIVAMSTMNDSSNACWASDCMVQLADGKQIATSSLRRGMLVRTPLGPRKVIEMVASYVVDLVMRREKSSDLRITSYHPVTDMNSSGQSLKWYWPHDDPTYDDIEYTGTIYSLLLEEDANADAHAVIVNGKACVTLGHGLVDDSADKRAHAYYGNYRLVHQDLKAFKRDASGVLQKHSAHDVNHSPILDTAGKTAT